MEVWRNRQFASSCPATGTFPSDTSTHNLFPHKGANLKKCERKSTKNGMKGTKTFLLKDYSRAIQINLLLTTAILNPFKMSTKHPRDQAQAAQLWMLQ